MHGIDWRVYACAAILQLEKARQQEKEDELKRALHENDARHDEHLKTLESRIAVRAYLPARQTASQPNCLPACLPARPPACLGVLDAHVWNASSMRGGHASRGSARTCTKNACHRRMHKHAAEHALRFPSPAIWQGNGYSPEPLNPPPPFPSTFSFVPGRPWKKRQVSRAPAEVPAAPGNYAWRLKQ